MRTRKVTRLIPLASNPTVKNGDPVEPTTVIARASRPARQIIVPVAHELNYRGSIAPLMMKALGEACKADEPIARRPGLFGTGKRVRSPEVAKLAAVYPALGIAVLEASSVPIEIPSLVRGNVIEVAYNRAIVIEVEGEFLWGACCFGTEGVGTLLPYDGIGATADPLGFYYADGPITAALLAAARARGVRVLIGATISPADWGRHSTSSTLTVVVLQGFGAAPLAAPLRELLIAQQGRQVALVVHHTVASMAPRPQLVFQAPGASTTGGTEDPADRELLPGHLALVLRSPAASTIGVVEAIEPQARRLPTGVRMPVARIRPPGQPSLIVPQQNLDPITE